jgi:hypothetical protein
MRKFNFLILTVVITIAGSCNKSENYSSLNEFYSLNGVPMQTYTINGTTGGSFTTPQGTHVIIPADAFVTQASVPVTGNITVEFKDIYKKSDMLLSNMPTITNWGSLLKSGGEAYIKITFNNEALMLAPGKKITIEMPKNLTSVDTTTGMQPFVALPDSMNIYLSWTPTANDTVYWTTSTFIYDLFILNSPEENGTWINCDNPSYFSSYTQTTLTFHSTQSLSEFSTQAFLIFGGISTVSTLWVIGSDLSYNHAPLGLPCTMVVIGLKDGDLYSSFVPITIGPDQIHNFALTQTTTGDFINHLESLN